MQYDEKLQRLKSLPLLSQIPERQLKALAEFLRPKPLEDNAVVFEEGSMGMSLYFLSSGRIRIRKRVSANAFKDLAILGPGDFFGENALVVEATRSATATASGPCVLFELFRGDLDRWVKLNPQQAVQFFAGLVHIQSDRLRRTSDELTLHLGLSDLLNDASLDTPAFLAQALDRMVSHIEGAWAAAAYICRKDGGPNELMISRGEGRFETSIQDLPPEQAAMNVWADDTTLRIPLAGRKRTLGCLVFRAAKPVAKTGRDDIGRTLAAAARLVATGLDIKSAP